MIDRRELSRLLTLAGAAAALAPAGASAAPPARAPLKPRRIAPGDTVGMVLPASLAFEATALDFGREQLEALGFRVKVGEHAAARHGYFAGTDRERVADLHAMFADEEVRAVFCHSGGWGTPRLLPLLDFELLRHHPKALVGFSDVTALLNAVHQQTGLVTFHGPVASSTLGPFTLDHLRRALMSAEPLGTLRNPEKAPDELVDRAFRVSTLRGGRARGRVVGGNLTLVAALMGTPWEIATDGAILLLEDVHEEYYRIDRMLTQLAQGGLLARAAGVGFGYCSDCPVKGPSLSLGEILQDHLASLGVPAVAGLAFGHIPKMWTLPLGLEATLDADAGTLTYEEAAVV